MILGLCRSWRHRYGLDGQVSYLCCFVLPLNVYFWSSGGFPMINWLKKRRGQRGNRILSLGITSSSAPGFCLEGDMAGGLHPQIPVQYQVVWSDHQRFGRNTIWSWCQGSLGKLYVAASFLIGRICGDIFVSCEWSGETASAAEGVIERGRWPLLRGSVRQSPELPLPLPGGSLVTWPGRKG